MINGTIEQDLRSRTLTESGMKISNTFNPKSGRQNVRSRWRCQRTERPTGRLEYRKNTLTNAGGLPKWSFSSVSHAEHLELDADFTP